MTTNPTFDQQLSKLLQLVFDDVSPKEQEDTRKKIDEQLIVLNAILQKPESYPEPEQQTSSSKDSMPCDCKSCQNVTTNWFVNETPFSADIMCQRCYIKKCSKHYSRCSR